VTTASSASVLMNRTEELYRKLDESPFAEADLDLDMFDFVLSPVTRGGRSHNVKLVGPAHVWVKQWPDGKIEMKFTLLGARPEPERVYVEASE
jgi:hypothetical protein